MIPIWWSRAEHILERYLLVAETIEAPANIVPTVTRDPDDDAVLACALAANVDLIVSGDAHLLNLKSYQRIPIVNATEALARIAKAGSSS